MEKQCSKCKQIKSLDNFQWHDKRKNRKSSRCKPCVRAYYLKTNGKDRVRNTPTPKEVKTNSEYRQYWWNKFKDGLHHVYLLPKVNYVGCTDNPVRRIENNHKVTYKRDISGARILYSTPDRDEAEELEALLHDMGYEGRHTNARKV